MTRIRKIPTRIVYIHNAPVPSRAANSVQVVKTCEALQVAGLSVLLVLPKSMGGTAAEIKSSYGLNTEIKVTTAFLPGVPGKELALGVLVALRERKPRTLLYTRSISIAYAAALVGRDVALELHDSGESARKAVGRRLRKLVCSPRLRLLVVISHALKRYYEESIPEIRGRVCVAPDAADPVSASPVVMPLIGSFNAGYVGQLYPGKGMEMIASVAPLCPAISFHVVGGNPEAIEQWRAQLRSCANVTFYGHVAHSEACRYICAMDVVLAPYQRTVRGVGMGSSNLAEWMSPLKLFEYMAAGKAIITSDLPALREVLEHDRDALLCDPDDARMWVDALHALQSSREQRNRLGAAARERFLLHYTWERRAQRILDALQKVSAGEAA